VCKSQKMTGHRSLDWHWNGN